jgi:hypothetical protein
MTGGGGIANSSTSTTILQQCTIVNNATMGLSRGGGIQNDLGGSVSMTVSILDKNTSPDSSLAGCQGSVSSGGGNFFGPNTCTGGPRLFNTPPDKVGSDALLEPLNNWTPQAHPPRPGSPVIDMVAPEYCSSDDQFFGYRPQGLKCDSGAVEFIPVL